MASKIRILRSTGATAPGSLEYGELAITIEQGTAGTSANKAGRLFIGNASNNPVELGGEYTYKLLDHVHGELTNSSAAIVDSNGEIDGWSVAGILTATRTNITDFVTSNLNVTGVSTFAQGLNLNGNVTIGDSHTDTLTVNARAGFTTDVTLDEDLLVTGISTFTGAIDANGGLDVSGGETILSSATVSDLTSGRVVLAGTSGALEDSGNFTFDGSTLTVTGDQTVSGTIDVQTDAYVGAGLSVVGVSTFTDAIDANNGLNVSGAESVLSSATVSDLTENRIVIVGTSGQLEDDANLTFDGSTLVVGATLDGTIIDATTLRAPVGVVTTLTTHDVVGAAATFTEAFTLGSGGTKYSFPVADGSVDQILVTNGSGSLSFSDVPSSMVISAGYASTDRVNLLTDTFTVAATNNETRTTLTDNTITVGLATDIVVGGGVTITNDLLVLGNLTVEGTETIINVDFLDVQDKHIGVASTSTASNITADGGGFFVHGGSDGDKTIFWSLTQSGFEVNQDWLPNADGSFDLGNTNREWQNLFVDGLAELDDVNVSAAATIATLNVTGTSTLATVDINAGNIDNTIIGAATTAAGTFTTLTAGTIVTGGRLDAGQTTFDTLRVTGVSTLASLILSSGTNTNGAAYFDANGQLQSTATPSAGIQTSNFILTTNASGVPSWTDTIDCGTF